MLPWMLLSCSSGVGPVGPVGVDPFGPGPPGGAPGVHAAAVTITPAPSPVPRTNARRVKVCFALFA
ncbi:unannotated protein [freshwater metagenome]|uniref:Unannotated protein n=1 Tax=freshwater metagenome TaxID=449393 RepID=A0A6J6ZC50_9ZZZZ